MHGEELTGEWIVPRLVDAGLWEEVPGGFRIHDFLDYNPSKVEVLDSVPSGRRRRLAGTLRGSLRGSLRGKPRESPRPPYPYPYPYQRVSNT